ncbi:MAG: methylenetetrahydrofolate reductase [NAD(P)H] [Candidatus Omnitrophica bacterium]|nr:methylenetetrahydrofolate reductase [NAD(P)H] [Candidatus Omnitrophota bacterium]
MRISDILKKHEEGITFEFFPPKTEKGRISFVNTVRILKKYNPLYVSMTYGAGGTTQERTKDAVKMLLDEKYFEVMPHLTCIGADKDNIALLLQEYEQQGIENIMALRGDLPLEDVGGDFSRKDFSYGCDLVKFIKKNKSFCIGIAVYPEGHIEALTLEDDMYYTKKKIDNGADFAVTQMFFDNSYYYALLDRMREYSIDIPVLPGILPLTDVEKVKQFAAVCRTTIPDDIEEKMERYKRNSEDMEKVGIEFTIKQCLDLMRNGIKQLHFFTLNKPNVITSILDAIGV